MEFVCVRVFSYIRRFIFLLVFKVFIRISALVDLSKPNTLKTIPKLILFNPEDLVCLRDDLFISK